MGGAQQDDPLGIVGTIVDGKYEIEALIGEGGAAVVYRAKNKEWDLRVALKFYLALASAPVEVRPKLLDEFVQEGRLMAKLSSKSAGITQPRDMGAITRPDGSWIPYLALEWLEGSPLDVVLVSETQKGMAPRSLEETIALLESAASALELAHREHVVHRDIKPENLFVLGDPRGPAPRLKVFDFGIAKVMQESIGVYVHTTAAATPFTPHYGAPEQFSRSYGTTGPWTDVYAFALVVLEVMRGGNRVFSGNDYVELSMQSRSEDVRPTPRVIGLDVNDDVEAVFARALAIRPQDRYQSAGEFWGSLWSAVFPQKATWRTEYSLAPPANTTDPNARSTTTGPSVSYRPGPRSAASSTILLAAIGGVIVLAIGGVFLGMKLGSSAAASASAQASVAPPAVTSAPRASASAAGPAPLCPESSEALAGGRFTMGDSDKPNANPPHGVILDAFCLDRAEVSAKAYGKCVEAGACTAPTNALTAIGGQPAGDPKACAHTDDEKDNAANCVSYDDAAAYCSWAKMRLPTEAEWEFAARSSKLDIGKTALGEWTFDSFDPYPPDDQVNPRGTATGIDRVVRGLKKPTATSADPAERGHAPEAARSAAVGFRCARDITHK